MSLDELYQRASSVDVPVIGCIGSLMSLVRFPRLCVQSGTMRQYSTVQYNRVEYCKGGKGIHIPAVFHGATLRVGADRAQPARCRTSGRAVARLQHRTMQRHRRGVGFACIVCVWQTLEHVLLLVGQPQYELGSVRFAIHKLMPTPPPPAC